MKASGELKTKPTQHSVKELRSIGIQPNIIICRTEKSIPKAERQKISLFCNVKIENVLQTIDVKTKRTTVTPKPDYDCSVAAFNTKQKCDKYVFVRVLNDLTKGWILGEMDKEEYFDNARLMKKGKIDPANGFRVRATCYNVAIQDLN